jgi:hypothetical protein
MCVLCVSAGAAFDEAIGQSARTAFDECEPRPTHHLISRKTQTHDGRCAQCAGNRSRRYVWGLGCVLFLMLVSAVSFFVCVRWLFLIFHLRLYRSIESINAGLRLNPLNSGRSGLKLYHHISLMYAEIVENTQPKIYEVCCQKLIAFSVTSLDVMWLCCGGVIWRADQWSAEGVSDRAGALGARQPSRGVCSVGRRGRSAALGMCLSVCVMDRCYVCNAFNDPL